LFDVVVGERDILVWKTSRGIYSCSETWNCLRTKFTEVAWSHVIWFPLAISKHAFLLWLVFRGALVRECVVGVMRATLYADSVMGGKSL